jgi:regulation of enolase protein 1 (concanavalin A-like superfamily)
MRLGIDRLQAMTFARCTWLNEPAVWRLDGGALTVTTDRSTDFWRETHYGFTHDTGHFFGRETAGDFTAEIRIQAQYRELYDQAGLMVRLSSAEWLKAGIELSDGKPMTSSVLTIGKSDWATAAHHGVASDFRMRVTVKAGVLRLQLSSDGKLWPLMRLCPFPNAESYRVGPMCCTPERAGLTVVFSEFRVTEPTQKDLHDLS